MRSAIQSMLLLVVASLLFSGCAWGDGYSFTTIDVPGALSTSALGINDAGQTVGVFTDADGTHGFIGQGGSFTTIDAFNPPSGQTWATGINDAGQVMGTILAAGAADGFLYDSGGITYLPAPFGYNYFSGINDSGQMVGYQRGELNPLTVYHGFVSDGQGALIPVNDPAGYLAPDGMPESQAYGINDSGQIVGTFTDSSGSHGFLDVGGVFTTLASSAAYGINDSGAITTGTGFIDQTGMFHPVDVPGASSTITWGINDSGAMVGTFVDVNGAKHGFLAVPIPEPGIVPILVTALAFLALFIGSARKRIPAD